MSRSAEAWALAAYRLAFLVALPLVGPPWLVADALRGRRRGQILGRLGFGLGRLGLPPDRVWVHAVSVGEVMAARRLIAAFTPATLARTVLSVTTATGLALARAGGPPDAAAIVPSPLDVGPTLTRFFSVLQPRAMVLIEAELWPNWLHQAARRGVPVALVNARVTTRSFARYRRFEALFRPRLRELAAVGARTDLDAQRLEQLGVRPDRLRVTGDIKFDVAPARWGRTAARARFGLPEDAPILVAGSLHPGEDGPVLAAFAALRARDPATTLVFVPRKSLSPPTGVGPVVVRSSGAATPPGGILFVDTIGELRDLYPVADVAFVGGSLVPVGGHNLLEAAAAGVPVLFGPHTESFAEPAAALAEAGGGLQVADGRVLLAGLNDLLGSEDRRRRMGAAARQVIVAGGGAVRRTIELLGPLLADRG